MAWSEQYNIAGIPKGSYRSIAGYAGESIVIGRALQCGFNLFFKAWRDSSYDGVLDNSGTLSRIEIKGSTTSSLSVTSGGRAGKQINRKGPRREHIIRKEDADFLIGVNNNNGECFIIPTEILLILNSKSLSLSRILVFKEKWAIFKGKRINNFNFSPNRIKQGFLLDETKGLIKILKKLNVKLKSKPPYFVDWSIGTGGNELRVNTKKKYLVLKIWKEIYSRI